MGYPKDIRRIIEVHFVRPVETISWHSDVIHKLKYVIWIIEPNSFKNIITKKYQFIS